MFLNFKIKTWDEDCDDGPDEYDIYGNVNIVHLKLHPFTFKTNFKFHSGFGFISSSESDVPFGSSFPFNCAMASNEIIVWPSEDSCKFGIELDSCLF